MPLCVIRRAIREALRWGALLVFLAPSAASAQGSWSSRLAGPRARGELTHPDPDARIRAAAVLARVGEPRRSLSALLDALEVEEDLRVRPALMEALARRGDEAAVPRLAQQLGDAGREDRAVALRAIGAIGGESAIRVLIEWLGASDVGEEAAEALRWIGAPAVPHLLRALGAPPAAARAARVLGEIGDGRATPALVHALREGLPAVRVAAAEALGRLADERAAPALARALDDPNEPVATAALAAIGRVGGEAFAPAVARMAEEGEPARRALALEALIAMDPALAASSVERLLRDGDAPLQAAIAEAIVAQPGAALVPALSALAREPEHAAAAAEALSRVPSGGGIDALLALPHEVRAVPLALAIRRHRATVEGGVLERARSVLVADGTLRGAVISALAGDASALSRLDAALSAEAPLDRASAALGIALLGSSGARDAVERALVCEQDPRVFRALALAARSLHVGMDAARLHARLADPATAPEAFGLAVRAAGESTPQTRRRLRRTLRRGLRETDPRVRAGAAVALGEAGDRAAWRALVELLEDEHDAVRLAAARALASLGVSGARDAIAARERVERDAEVKRALRAALAPGAGPVVLEGSEPLYVRIEAAPGPREQARELLEVDVLLPDGRWLRTFALAGGEVLLPRLPAGEAEVQVRL